jgi:hypothetical protein
MLRQITVIALAAALPAATLAQDIPLIPLVPPGLVDKADAGEIDLNGVWEFATGNHQGGCPFAGPGFPMGGLMEITQAEGAIAMQIVSGAVCDPASMCAFTGEIADGDLILMNHDTVDEEGGTVTNTLHLVLQSPDFGQGVGGALYNHPKMQCIWNWDIFFHRPEISNGEWKPGAAQQGQ